MASLSGPWVLTDPDGWVIGAHEVVPPAHISLPAGPADRAVLTGLGVMRTSHLDGTVLLVPVAMGEVDVAYRLDPARGILTTAIGGVTTTHELSARHVAILGALAESESPLSVNELSRRVWGSEYSAVTTRAEVSRLRKKFPGLVSSAPYRLLADLPAGSAPT